MAGSTDGSTTFRSCEGSVARHTPENLAVQPGKKPRLGFIWDTPLKPGERHIRRQVLGSRVFEPVVLTEKPVAEASRFPAMIVPLNQHKRRWRKLHRKHFLRAPRCVYNGEPEALIEAAETLGLRLVHVFFGHVAIRRLVCLRLLDVPFTVSFHGIDVGWCSSKSELSRHLPELFARAACIMARSAFMGTSLAALGCPESKIWISRAGIPVDDFIFRRRRRSTSAALTVLQVSRLISKKGLGDTIRAFRTVRNQFPDARLWIAGDGPLRADLERQTSSLGLEDSVRFLGFLEPDALLGRLHEADLFVHPSSTSESGDREGIPNSMLEAMATGLPPITTRHAGIPEAIKDGWNGWMVPERSPDRLAERMLWCARNPGAVTAAGEAARQFVEQHHSLDGRMRLLDAKYEELIRDHPMPDRPRRSVRARLREIELPRYRT